MSEPIYPVCFAVSMGKRCHSKAAAEKRAKREMASFPTDKHKHHGTFRQKQKATILSGLRALGAPAVAQLVWEVYRKHGRSYPNITQQRL